MAQDRNQDVKKQLLKKRDEATRRKIPLAPGEMVDDAVARGLAGTGRWLKANFGMLQWIFVGAVVVAIGYFIYEGRVVKRAETASGELVKGTVAEKGRIAGSSSPKPEEDLPDDPIPVFKSIDEKRDTALASYRKVVSSYPGTGAAILARLGEAGVLLDKRNWDGALAAYGDVKASALASADPTVRASALEGIGLAKEGKGDVEGALKAFHELEETIVTGQRELGMYHQARILFGKGDTEKAKTLLIAAKERLKKAKESFSSSSSPSPQGGDPRPFGFLESQLDDLLRRIDPTAVPSAAASRAGAGKGMSAEDIQRLQEQLQLRLKDQQKNPSAPAGTH